MGWGRIDHDREHLLSLCKGKSFGVLSHAPPASVPSLSLSSALGLLCTLGSLKEQLTI